MELRDHLAIIWRRKWQILAASLAVALLVFAWSDRRADVYRAETELIVNPNELAGDAAERSVFLAASWAQVATTDPVIRDAIERADIDLTLADGRSLLSASSAEDVGFIRIAATGPSPERAVALAGAAGDALVAAINAQQDRQRSEGLAPLDAQITELRGLLAAAPPDSPEADSLTTQLGALVSQRAQLATRPLDRLDVVEPPSAGGSPVSPTPMRDAALALIVALVVNAELAVLLHALSDRFSVNDDEEVTRITGLPVLARIPTDTAGDAVEPFRILRTNLMFLGSMDNVHALAVVGNGRGIGRTDTAVGLAAAAARLSVRVTLVDGDLRHPAIHDNFEIPLQPGLGDLRPGDDPVKVAVGVEDLPDLRVIPAGELLDDPSGLLSGEFRHIIGKLTGSADLVVVDTPAADQYAEATAIAAQCDAVVVVIDPTARRRPVKALIASLQRVGATPLGLVLNRFPA